MSKDVSPFILMGSSNASKFSELFNRNLRELYSSWFSSSHNFKFNIVNSNEPLNIDLSTWSLFANSKDCWIAFKNDNEIISQLISEMIGDQKNSVTKVTNFVSSIYNDFIDSNVSSFFSLANMVLIKGSNIKNINQAFGSGTLIGNISNGNITFPILIGGGIVDGICGISKNINKQNIIHNLSKRETLILNTNEKIKVLAGSVIMTIEELNNIEIGDVVILDSKIQDLFAMYNSSGKYLTNVQLGKRFSQKAIQITE